MAIDQAGVSGWSILFNDKLIDYGLINLKKQEKPMLFFYQSIVKLINKYEPNIIAWEDLKTNRNANTIRYLGRYSGILEMIAEEFNLEVITAIPVSIRSKTCKCKGSGTRGHKTKLDVAKEMAKRYNLVLPSNKEIYKVHTKGKNKDQSYIDEEHEFFNITDSIALGLYCYIVRD